MDILNMLVAVVALVIAILAFQRTGGIEEVRRQIEIISATSENRTKGFREATADAISRLEQIVRTAGKHSSNSECNPHNPQVPEESSSETDASASTTSSEKPDMPK